MPEWMVPGYTELKRLGSGGFGDVVLARHDGSGNLVAIKHLRRDLLADPGFAGMFREEAAVLASLQDPNVVRLYEYVESRAGAAIVMELIGGVSLREILLYQGRTTAEAALVVLEGSLLGLAAAHRRGVVHRDYKPENVLVNGDGLSKLTDFGIAARAGDRPLPAGTPHYAAPEQMAGAPATPASDVYAATATFYECLTGRPPFDGDADALMRQHRHAPVPLEAVPGPLQPLVAGGMAKDPRLRPADAAAFAGGLQAAASGAYGPGWRERGRSHLAEAALLLAALWPAGPPPAGQGVTVHRTGPRRASRLRHIGAARAAIAAGAAIAVTAAAATALAATGSPSLRPSAISHPVVVQPVSLQPTATAPTRSPDPGTLPSPPPQPGPGTPASPAAGTSSSSSPVTSTGTPTSSAAGTGTPASSSPGTASGTSSSPGPGTPASSSPGTGTSAPPTPPASVCEPDGTGCTGAGTYPGPDALISSDYTGFKVVWTSSVVRQYSSGVPLYWTAYLTYTNITSSSLTLGCPGDWASPGNVAEIMSGGDGDDGLVYAETTNCSQNPDEAVAVPPGGTYTTWATFRNVPWPGVAVTIQWGDAGSSPAVYPFTG
jgi:eukaryotic-like serine/threonine-protein kinase